MLQEENPLNAGFQRLIGMESMLSNNPGNGSSVVVIDLIILLFYQINTKCKMYYKKNDIRGCHCVIESRENSFRTWNDVSNKRCSSGFNCAEMPLMVEILKFIKYSTCGIAV